MGAVNGSERFTVIIALPRKNLRQRRRLIIVERGAPLKARAPEYPPLSPLPTKQFKNLHSQHFCNPEQCPYTKIKIVVHFLLISFKIDFTHHIKFTSRYFVFFHKSFNQFRFNFVFHIFLTIPFWEYFIIPV